jgi:aminocarboxymuconate-semialdehyde decarboxylase
MKIDIAAHILPQKYVDEMAKKGPVPFQDLLNSYPTVVDLDSRLRIMDKYPDMVQVLTMASPIVGPSAVEMAKIANDALAELVAHYPDRFVAAVAALPIGDMEATLKETDRAINELNLRGVLIRASIHGNPIDSPEYMPLYEKMSNYNLPIWIHPWRLDTVPDYTSEEKSKYMIWHVFGWVYETTVAMARLVFSGVLEKYPNLKFITHHCGAMIPFFEHRISLQYESAEIRRNINFRTGLTKSIIDYFRMFFADTAVNGSTAALMCGHAFFGPEQLLFGTDMPHDSQLGDSSIRETVKSIEDMNISESDKKKIFEDNARKLLRLP